jgi:hypothetical protein
VLGVVFFALILMLLLSWLIPQSPVPSSDPVVFSRWLAETRTTLGQSADFLAAVGLLNLRNSLGMRLLMVSLVLILTVRMTTLAERWPRWTTTQHWIQGLIIIGAVAIVVGWSLQILFGWSETNLIAWEDEATASNHSFSVAAPRRPFSCFVDKTYGLFLISQGKRNQGVRVHAEGDAGQSLPLRTSSRSEPKESLKIPLTQESPDVYFALPEEELGFRISLQPEDQGIYVQVYRFASGALITDTVFQDTGDVSVADVHVYLERISYTRFTLVYNPGAPLIGLGLLLLGGGNFAILVLSKGREDMPLVANVLPEGDVKAEVAGVASATNVVLAAEAVVENDEREEEQV